MQIHLKIKNVIRYINDDIKLFSTDSDESNEK